MRGKGEKEARQADTGARSTLSICFCRWCWLNAAGVLFTRQSTGRAPFEMLNRCGNAAIRHRNPVLSAGIFPPLRSFSCVCMFALIISLPELLRAVEEERKNYRKRPEER